MPVVVAIRAAAPPIRHRCWREKWWLTAVLWVWPSAVIPCWPHVKRTSFALPLGHFANHSLINPASRKRFICAET